MSDTPLHDAARSGDLDYAAMWGDLDHADNHVQYMCMHVTYMAIHGV